MTTTQTISREQLITSEIADFFAGFVEVYTELGDPNTVEEAQAQLTERVLATLAAMDSEPVAKTQFKAVADLYEIDSGSSTPFTKSASEATKAAYNGYKVQEYVKLERLQAVYAAPPAPVVLDIGKIRVGRLPTMNQDEYPGLGDWWVQLRIGEDSDEVLARVYGATPQEANNRAEVLACRAAMQAESVTEATVLDDTRRMDWLVSKTVNVREPLVYGSRDLFWSQTISDDWEEKHKTTLREQIDAAMDAEKPAAPEQEV